MFIADLIAQWGSILLQLLVATLCGGVIGYQREVLDRPAGFRTHVLVCVGSAVYMLVSIAIAGEKWDPGRIAAQVASGMGFLGAGTIIKQGSIVRGLTTAASLWSVAGIGLAVGLGGHAMAIALLGTLMVFIALSLFRNLERYMERGRDCSLRLLLTSPHQQLEGIQRILAEHRIEMRDLTVQAEHGGQGEVLMEGRTPTYEEFAHAVTEIARDENVKGIHWQCR